MNQITACDRAQLVDAIVAFVIRKSGIAAGDARASIEGAIDELGDGAVGELQSRLAGSCDLWAYYPGDPLARRVHQVLAGVLLKESPSVHGVEHLAAVRGRPAVIVANHLSYSDANVIEVLLMQSGCRELADRLAVVAGPKVYSDISRRFSSLCFGTIKSPQNEGVSTGDAAMSAREVARAARQTIEAAEARLRAGDAVLVFPEGTRSRTGAMQPFLPGVSRYFETSGLWVVPIGLCGTEHMFAIGEQTLGSAQVSMTIGRPFPAEAMRGGVGTDRRRFMDDLGRAVASLLPPPYRGVYATSGAD